MRKTPGSIADPRVELHELLSRMVSEREASELRLRPVHVYATHVHVAAWPRESWAARAPHAPEVIS